MFSSVLVAMIGVLFIAAIGFGVVWIATIPGEKKRPSDQLSHTLERIETDAHHARKLLGSSR